MRTTIATNNISWWKTSFGDEEVESLRQAVANENISEGELTIRLEKELAESLGVPFVVMTTSGSVALYLALTALGIGKGDEVVVPNRTWIATAHAVLLTGAKAVLVDVCEDVPLIDPSRIREKITNKTKAILTVHLNGRASDMMAINQIAQENNLLVMEDAAQALFSKNENGFLGTQSEAGCFSMGISKLISTGQGGFVVTNKKEIYDQMKLIKNHGVTDIFTDTWSRMGFNFKFTDLLASFGLVQLENVQKRINHLKEIYQKYEEGIKGLSFLKMVPLKVSAGEFPIYAETLCPNRSELIDHLKINGIQCRPVPPNLDISDYIENDKNYPNSRKFSEQGLYLPSGPTQSIGNIDSVVEALLKFV